MRQTANDVRDFREFRKFDDKISQTLNNVLRHIEVFSGCLKL